MTKGNIDKALGTLANPSSIAARLMESNELIPSIDRMQVDTSISTAACKACATHSVPALVLKHIKKVCKLFLYQVRIAVPGFSPLDVAKDLLQLCRALLHWASAMPLVFQDAVLAKSLGAHVPGPSEHMLRAIIWHRFHRPAADVNARP